MHKFMDALVAAVIVGTWRGIFRSAMRDWRNGKDRTGIVLVTIVLLILACALIIPVIWWNGWRI